MLTVRTENKLKLSLSLCLFLTSLILRLLREDFEVEEPGLQPGHHEGDDGEHVAEGIFSKQLQKIKNKNTLFQM